MKVTKSTYHKLFLFLSAALAPQVSHADIYRPTTAVQLITAVIAANASTADDIIDLNGNTITFANNCFAIAPTDPSCDTQNALPIIATAISSGRLEIINGGIERSPTAGLGFRLLQTVPGSYLSLFNVTLTNGLANDGDCSDVDDNCYGGAIYNSGYLEIQNSTIANNQSFNSGGAIFNDVGAALAIQSSDINSNIAQNNEAGTGGGGGIYNAILITNSIRSITYGLIETIANTTIADNSTPGYGGGINNQGQALNIYNSTISNNYACSDVVGGICPDPSTGAGGGIYNGQQAITLQITNTTIAENQANEGGGIYLDGIVPILGTRDNIPAVLPGIYIYNSTISSNIANEGGGGIFNSQYSVISGLVSTIIACNIDTQSPSSPTYSPDIIDWEWINSGYTTSHITFEEYNLIGNNGYNDGDTVIGTTELLNGTNGDIVGSEQSPINPELGPLEYNGGFTYTIALLPMSPAINQGLNPYSLTNDQRGPDFHRVKCSRPDIGAFERQLCF